MNKLYQYENYFRTKLFKQFLEQICSCSSQMFIHRNSDYAAGSSIG